MTNATATQPDAATIASYRHDPMRYFADSIIPGVTGDVRLGDCWADFQREAFEMLSRCLLAVAAGEKPQHRGVWIERTKGASKDSDVGLALTWLLLFSPRPQLIELGADDLGQIQETHKAMGDDLRLNRWKAERLTVHTTRIRNESTGSQALFLTRDASGSHGSRPTATVCNELSHCQSEEFISTMMDNADKNSRNLAIIATNAGMLKTWQHRWRENYRHDPSWWFQSVTKPAPWISEENIQQAERRNPPARFRRLWRGEWVTPGGDALPAESIEKAIKHTGPLHVRELGQQRAHTVCGIGVDVGLTTHHAAIVCVVGCHETQTLRIADVEDIAPPVSLQFVRDTIIEMGERFRTRWVSCDPWQMMRVAEELQGMGYHVDAQHQTGSVLTRQAAAFLEVFRDGRLELFSGYPAADLLIEDIYSARIVERSYGHKIAWAENESGHGDRGAALAMVLPAALEGLGQPFCGFDDGASDAAWAARARFERALEASEW